MPYDQLQKQMNYGDERDIRFSLGEGSTGCAFVTGQHKKAVRLHGGPEQWAQVFKLSDEQKRRIHKDLEWAISFPLHSGGETLAVLNIDCLHHPMTEDALGEVFTLLLPSVAAFEQRLAREPQVIVSLRAEEPS